MFPIAESIAALLYGNTANRTAANLSKFIREDLGEKDPRYKALASTLCQVWRHGQTHHDEPPFLIVRPATISPLRFDLDSRAVSWELVFNDRPAHMSFNTNTGQNIQFTFSLCTFAEDLLAVLNDSSRWSGFAPAEVMDRYNEWSVKVVNDADQNESGQAAREILALLP